MDYRPLLRKVTRTSADRLRPVSRGIGLWGTFKYGLAIGPVVGGLATLGRIATYLFENWRTDDTSPLSPIDSWRRDQAFGLMYGLIIGLWTGLACGLWIGLDNGLVGGLVGALWFGLMNGLLSAETWPTSLTFAQLAMRWHTPVRLMRFLEDARERDVLRTVGPVYQFRHARLQDRLAEQASAPTSPEPQAIGTSRPRDRSVRPRLDCRGTGNIEQVSESTAITCIADRLLAAELCGAALHHAKWRDLTEEENAAAVAELRALASGRADLLAEQAGLLIGSSRARSTSHSNAALPGCSSRPVPTRTWSLSGSRKDASGGHARSSLPCCIWASRGVECSRLPVISRLGIADEARATELGGEGGGLRCPQEVLRAVSRPRRSVRMAVPHEPTACCRNRHAGLRCIGDGL